MCFSQQMSFINFGILTLYGSYIKIWRLSIPLIYLGLKDLIQGLLYYNINNPSILEILSVISFIHICLQPFIFNMAFSYFDTPNNKKNYWNYIFLFTILWGLWKLTTHEWFDIQNDKNYVDENDDYHSSKNTAYIGKLHIGYKFTTEKKQFYIPYIVALLLPSLFTRVYPIGIFLLIIVLILKQYSLFYNVKSGEFSALWCFIGIIFFIPIVFFRKNILKLIH